MLPLPSNPIHPGKAPKCSPARIKRKYHHVMTPTQRQPRNTHRLTNRHTDTHTQTHTGRNRQTVPLSTSLPGWRSNSSRSSPTIIAHCSAPAGRPFRRYAYTTVETYILRVFFSSSSCRRLRLAFGTGRALREMR